MFNPEGLNPDFENTMDDGGLQAIPEHGLDTSGHPSDNFGERQRLARARQDTGAYQARERLLNRPNPAIEEARQRAAAEEARRKAMLEERRKKDEGQSLDNLVTDADRKKLNDSMVLVAQKNRDLITVLDGTDRPVIDDANCFDGDQFLGLPHYSEDVLNACHTEIENCERGFKNHNEKAIGPVMEKIAMALISKYFPGQACVGTWKFDDYTNGVDNVFFFGGEALVVFDEVMGGNSAEDKVREGKKAKVKRGNISGGAEVKFCTRKEGNKTILAPDSNLPVIKIDLNMKAMLRAIKSFDLDGPKNDGEGCAIYCIIKNFYDQVRDIENLLLRNKINFGVGATGRENRSRFEGKLNAFKALLAAQYPEDELEKTIKELNDRVNGRRPKKRRVKRK